MESIRNFFRSSLLYVAILALVIFGVVLYGFFTHGIREITDFQYISERNNPLELSAWGDYVGGVWGTFISLFSLIFTVFGSFYVYYTYKNQKDQSSIDIVINLIFRNMEKVDSDLLRVSLSIDNRVSKEMEAINTYTSFAIIFNRRGDRNLENSDQDAADLMEINRFELPEVVRFRTTLTRSLIFLRQIINDPSRNLSLEEINFLYQVILSHLDILAVHTFLVQSERLLTLRRAILERRDRTVPEPFDGMGDAVVRALNGQIREINLAITCLEEINNS